MSGSRGVDLLDPIAFIEAYFCVVGKGRRVVPFILNPIQREFAEKWKARGAREIVLKARQVGISTVILAMFLYDTITNEGTNTVIIGHNDKAVTKLLRSTKAMLRSLPPELRPSVKYDNTNEITFDRLSSSIYISTYNKLSTRSQTVHNLHITEIAFWKGRDIETLVAGMTESVPETGNIIIESTPHGEGDLFHRYVTDAMAGNSAYRLWDLPWWKAYWEYRVEREEWPTLHERIRPEGGGLELDATEQRLSKENDVSLEQLMWRRKKMLAQGDMRIGKDGSRVSRVFAEEYECDFRHSGSKVFDPDIVRASCHYQEPIEGRHYVHGCDTSEGVDGGNYSVMETMCVETGEFVAQIRGRWTPGLFAEKVHAQAMRYGGTVGVERNNTGHAVLLRLVQLWKEVEAKGTPPPYRIYADRDGKMGYITTETSRVDGIDDLRNALRDGSVKLAHEDVVGIGEMRAWTYDAKEKALAPSGGHDDTIFGKIIAWQMRKRRGARDETQRVGRATLL